MSLRGDDDSEGFEFFNHFIGFYDVRHGHDLSYHFLHIDLATCHMFDGLNSPLGVSFRPYAT